MYDALGSGQILLIKRHPISVAKQIFFYSCNFEIYRTCHIIYNIYIVNAEVDLATATVAELHTKIAELGFKPVGSTFQDATMDPTFMDYVEQKQPNTVEKELFKKYMIMLLQGFHSNAPAFPAKFKYQLKYHVGWAAALLSLHI
jgi:hypothetical protein